MGYQHFYVCRKKIYINIVNQVRLFKLNIVTSPKCDLTSFPYVSWIKRIHQHKLKSLFPVKLSE